MINSVGIINFETHLNTFFELHPGVNTFVGESDEGKSGIVRSIKWNAQNRPLGDAYRNDQLDPKEDKKEIVQVSVDYIKGLVSRKRNGVPGGINQYTINDGKPLRALRTDVPDEVQEVTKMKDINIQGQHPSEQYFLLAEKPGQVAKEFNKVAGLTIMDKATADINSQVRACNAEISVAKEEIETQEEKLEETKWVVSAEKLANKLGKFRTKLLKKDEECGILNNLVIEIESIDEKLKYYARIDEAKEALETLEKEKNSIIEKRKSLNLINSTVSDIKLIDRELLNTNDTTDALKALEALIEFEDAIKDAENKVQIVENLVKQYQTIEKELAQVEEEQAGLEVERDIMFENTACPTCGRSGK